MARSASSRGPTPLSRLCHVRGRRTSGVARRQLSGERGAASVELAVTFPVVLLLVMTLIQAALWFYARSVALGAAQEGAREGRVQPASTARAQSAAEGFLDQTAEDLFPGLSGWAVTQSAVGPVERPTP